MVNLKRYSKAISGGVTAGLAVLMLAIQTVTGEGNVVVEAAWHVSGQEWATIFGAVLAGAGLVAASPANKTTTRR